jgi:AcrR family transcriptional regulator
MALTVANVKSGSRRDKALATRQAIINAAHEEFVQHGFHGATIASIAARAHVATQTVYFTFHSKPELISAVIDHAVLGADPEVPQATAWWAAMKSAPRADDALRLFVTGAAPVFARASAVSEILRAAALTDSEVRRTYEFHESLRNDAFRQVVQILADKGPLRPELTIETATDILMTVFGDSTHHLLTTSRGWSHEQVVDWLCQALPVLLLEPRPDAVG